LETTLRERKPVSGLTRGYLICLAGTTIWSTVAIFISYLTNTYNIPALVLAFWRDAMMAGTLAIIFALFTPRLLRLERRHIRFMLVYGLVLTLFNSLWTISVVYNGAAVSTVLAYSSAAFTAIFGRILFGEKLNLVKIVAVMLSLIGCVFVSGAYDVSTWTLNPLGVITGLASGVAFAAYSLFGKSASDRSINPWTTLIYAFGVAAGFLLILNIFNAYLPAGVASTNLFWLDGAISGWLVLFILAIGPTVGGYGLYLVSLTYLPASVANIIATLEPSMTAVWAFLLLGERFTPPQWIGSILIIAGVVVLRIGEQRSPAS
jgi:drug/metabolite transporter (DMT)-like permease